MLLTFYIYLSINSIDDILSCYCNNPSVHGKTEINRTQCHHHDYGTVEIPTLSETLGWSNSFSFQSCLLDYAASKSRSITVTRSEDNFDPPRESGPNERPPNAFCQTLENQVPFTFRGFLGLSS